VCVCVCVCVCALRCVPSFPSPSSLRHSSFFYPLFLHLAFFPSQLLPPLSSPGLFPLAASTPSFFIHLAFIFLAPSTPSFFIHLASFLTASTPSFFIHLAFTLLAAVSVCIGGLRRHCHAVETAQRQVEAILSFYLLFFVRGRLAWLGPRRAHNPLPKSVLRGSFCKFGNFFSKSKSCNQNPHISKTRNFADPSIKSRASSSKMSA
jgi:hypothetical protein